MFSFDTGNLAVENTMGRSMKFSSHTSKRSKFTIELSMGLSSRVLVESNRVVLFSTTFSWFIKCSEQNVVSRSSLTSSSLSASLHWDYGKAGYLQWLRSSALWVLSSIDISTLNHRFELSIFIISFGVHTLKRLGCIAPLLICVTFQVKESWMLSLGRKNAFHKFFVRWPWAKLLRIAIL